MTDNIKPDHALLSASGSSRWVGCPASVAMEHGVTEDPSEYAEEGIKAHKLASDEIDYWDKSNGLEDNSPLTLCTDKDMSNYVSLYIDYLAGLQDSDSRLFLEQKVNFSNAVINGYGTADAIIINTKTNHLDVVDLKYGFNEVLAKDNTQMLLYAIGTINSIYSLFTRSVDDPETITLHIAQPRINNFDTWTITYEELQDWIKYFKVQSIKALTLNDEFNPSITNCKYCKAKKHCPALSSFVDNLTVELKEKIDAGTLFAGGQSLKKDFDNNFIKKVLDNTTLIKSYLQMIEDTARERLIYGEEIEGYKLVRSMSRRKLNKDAEDELRDCYGDKIYQKTLLGLTALEKVLGKRNLDNYTHKSLSGLAIVKDTDKRQSVKDLIKFENVE
jgi:hypothetical protein